MRITAVALGAFALVASAVSAGAAPAVPAAPSPQATNIVEVAGGCGWDMHRYRGHCMRNHGRPHAYYRGPRVPYPYYGGGYGPMNRPTPGDHVANQLNAHELGY